jgi:hypothetical protein
MKNSLPLPLIGSLALIVFATLACAFFGGPLTPTPTLDFGPTHGPLTVSPAVLPHAKQGQAYEVEIKISHNDTPVGSMGIGEGKLPAGLTFEFLNGQNAARISGTPSEQGTFKFRLAGWCYGTMVSGQTIDKDYEIVVGP